MPISENCIRSAAPIAAEPLAFPKWKVVKNASRELVVEVDLGEPPIQLAGSGQRPVHRTRKRAESVWKSGIKSPGVGIAQQSIQAVSRALLRLELQRIISGTANVVVVGDSGELAVWRNKSATVGTTSESVTGNNTARSRGPNVLVQTV